MYAVKYNKCDQLPSVSEGNAKPLSSESGLWRRDSQKCWRVRHASAGVIVAVVVSDALSNELHLISSVCPPDVL